MLGEARADGLGGAPSAEIAIWWKAWWKACARKPDFATAKRAFSADMGWN